MRTPLLLALLLAALPAHPTEVLQVTWPTAHAAEPAALPPPASNLLPAFRLALRALPESATVALALSQPGLLGLTPAEAGSLQPLTAERYRLLAQSPWYAQAASALPYSFAEKKPTFGLATVYVPQKAGVGTPVILFLHGYGGSFLWYLHYLSEIFPHHIVICPAYGISTAAIPQDYVAESIVAVSKRLGFQLSTPCLIGLSAGGFGACGIYTSAPRFYSRMICLAAYPPDETVTHFLPGMQPRFLSGALEPFVTSGNFRQRIARIRRICPAVEAVTVPGADHFFLLTRPNESAEYLRRWVLAAP